LRSRPGRFTQVGDGDTVDAMSELSGAPGRRTLMAAEVQRWLAEAPHEAQEADDPPHADEVARALAALQPLAPPARAIAVETLLGKGRLFGFDVASLRKHVERRTPEEAAPAANVARIARLQPPVGDSSEHEAEADRAADQVMNGGRAPWRRGRPQGPSAAPGSSALGE